jgi:MinD-like ATPase involved in chromosome partitioning or flagellar assembly
VARPAIVVALPLSESTTVSAELLAAGFEVISIEFPRELEKALDARRDIALAILDGELDPEETQAYEAALRGAGRPIPSLTVVSPRAFERLSSLVEEDADNEDSDNEYFTRPYSADSIRWRVEAMCIRRETVDDGSGPILQGGDVGMGAWGGRATTIAIFNPKGGVGKTTVATNLAAALQLRKGKTVLLIDADTVTGHVTTSLGIDAVRTVADSWRDELEGGPVESLYDIASSHPSGMKVVALTDSPLHTDVLDPARIGAAIAAARGRVDVIVIDLHPSYSTLNQAIFDEADRILIPVTPDVPAIRAAVQLRDVAGGLGCRERLAMVINRANSGISVEDMERTVGMPALSLIRSGGLLFVRAANEGRTVIEMFPKEKITADFDLLADRVLGTPKVVPPVKTGFRMPTRSRETARA